MKVQLDYEVGVYEIPETMVEDSRAYDSVPQSVEFLYSKHLFPCVIFQLVLQSISNYSPLFLFELMVLRGSN